MALASSARSHFDNTFAARLEYVQVVEICPPLSPIILIIQVSELNPLYYLLNAKT